MYTFKKCVVKQKSSDLRGHARFEIQIHAYLIFRLHGPMTETMQSVCVGKPDDKLHALMPEKQKIERFANNS